MNTKDRNPTPLAQLFKQRRKKRKWSQTLLAEYVRELLGPEQTFSQQTYAAFESGETRHTKFALQIAQALGVSMDEVASASSASATPASAPSTLLAPIEVWDDDTPLGEDEVEVPLLKEVELSAGSGRTAIQEVTHSKLRFGRRTLRRMGVEPENAVCASVSGNSMEPVLPDGSTVGVDKGKTMIKDGDMYVLRHGDHLRVKLLYRLPRGGIRLRSFNHDEHPDEEYPQAAVIEEEIEIIGRVFWYSVLR
ncbi:S24 family peptidase [Pseudomonas aeruginosa]|uniref:S24 family peptidase n=1 Tax=Pseudomonas nitroreducens TaxID=46680 RepID=UPI00244CE46F|nr:S24 family peptidase [Pseudomonas nitroreducens]MDG9855638.1 helix-turn-helix domain-containing protein [Pseudomonas nitroreducens]